MDEKEVKSLGRSQKKHTIKKRYMIWSNNFLEKWIGRGKQSYGVLIL